MNSVTALPPSLPDVHARASESSRVHGRVASGGGGGGGRQQAGRVSERFKAGEIPPGELQQEEG